jgi:hypothetical protein
LRRQKKAKADFEESLGSMASLEHSDRVTRGPWVEPVAILDGLVFVCSYPFCTSCLIAQTPND